MNISTEYKISLTQDELNRIIAAHCGFPLDSKIVLTIEEQTTDAGGWISVPSGWKENRCPQCYPLETLIDVMFRDGDTIMGQSIESWDVNWAQRGQYYDIIKYRVSKG